MSKSTVQYVPARFANVEVGDVVKDVYRISGHIEDIENIENLEGGSIYRILSIYRITFSKCIFVHFLHFSLLFLDFFWLFQCSIAAVKKFFEDVGKEGQSADSDGTR